MTTITHVKAVDEGRNVFLTKMTGTNQLWISIAVNGGSANCNLDKQGAEDLIAKIQSIIAEME